MKPGAFHGNQTTWTPGNAQLRIDQTNPIHEFFFSFLVGLNWGNKAAIYNAGRPLCSFEVEKVDMIGL